MREVAGQPDPDPATVSLLLRGPVGRSTRGPPADFRTSEGWSEALPSEA